MAWEPDWLHASEAPLRPLCVHFQYGGLTINFPALQPPMGCKGYTGSESWFLTDQHRLVRQFDELRFDAKNTERWPSGPIQQVNNMRKYVSENTYGWEIGEVSYVVSKSWSCLIWAFLLKKDTKWRLTCDELSCFRNELKPGSVSFLLNLSLLSELHAH